MNWHPRSHKTFRSVTVTVLCCIFFLFHSISSRAWADDLARLSGTVFDPTGAVVGRASVNLKAIAEQREQHTVTNSDGFYSFVGVPPGVYLLRIKAEGFKPVA